MLGQRVEVTIKFKKPGKRGYSYRHSLAMSWPSASSWLHRAWTQEEEDGGEIIAAIVTPVTP